MNTTITLSNGKAMPVLGLGTYLITSNSCGGYKKFEELIDYAHSIGIRHFDTATFYQNETELGKALSKYKREELFVTTKLWYSDHGYENALKAFHQSLSKLQMSYVDLYLIHYPGTSHDETSPKNKILRKESWKALEELYKQGKCKAIGVSNYTVTHLKEMEEYAQVLPMINQVELHPLLTQSELIQYCHTKGIQITAYSQFAKGELLKNKQILALAEAYQVTPAQLLTRYIIDKRLICIPKTQNKERLKENCDIWNFQIKEEDLKKLDAMNRNYHCTWDPTHVQ